MSEFNYTDEQAIAMLTRREELRMQMAQIEEEVKAIDKEFKKLPQQDDANIFGIYKVWWKQTTKMSPRWDYVKKHAPSVYEKCKEEVKSDYFMIRL